MDSSMLGFAVLHHLPEFGQTHVHRVGDPVQPSVVPASDVTRKPEATVSHPRAQGSRAVEGEN